MTLVPVKTLQIDTYCKNTYKIPLYIWYALVLAEGAFLVMMMMMVMTIVMMMRMSLNAVEGCGMRAERWGSRAEG